MVLVSPEVAIGPAVHTSWIFVFDIVYLSGVSFGCDL